MEDSGSRGFCERCGAQVGAGDAFCVSCGKRVERRADSEAPGEHSANVQSSTSAGAEPLYSGLRERMEEGTRWAQRNPARIALGCGGVALLLFLLGGCAVAVAFVGGGFSGVFGGSSAFTSEERSFISSVRSNAYELSERTDREIVGYGRETCDLFDYAQGAYYVESELYSNTPISYGYYEVNTVMLHGVENFCPEHSGAMSEWYDY